MGLVILMLRLTEVYVLFIYIALTYSSLYRVCHYLYQSLLVMRFTISFPYLKHTHSHQGHFIGSYLFVCSFIWKPEYQKKTDANIWRTSCRCCPWLSLNPGPMVDITTQSVLPQFIWVRSRVFWDFRTRHSLAILAFTLNKYNFICWAISVIFAVFCFHKSAGFFYIHNFVYIIFIFFILGLQVFCFF